MVGVVSPGATIRQRRAFGVNDCAGGASSRSDVWSRISTSGMPGREAVGSKSGAGAVSACAAANASASVCFSAGPTAGAAGSTTTTFRAAGFASTVLANAPRKPGAGRCHVVRTGPAKLDPSSTLPLETSRTTSFAPGGPGAAAPSGRLPKRSAVHGTATPFAVSSRSGGCVGSAPPASGCVAATVQFVPYVISPGAASASSTRYVARTGASRSSIVRVAASSGSLSLVTRSGRGLR